MIKQFCENHRKALIITLSVIIVAIIVTISTVYALNPKDDPVTPVVMSSDTTSKDTSSVEVSSIPVSSTIVVPEIKKPVSSAAVSSKDTSSEAAPNKATSSAPVVKVDQNVSDKKETPVEKPVSKPVAKPTESKPQTPATPQPNPELAKPANRNMPSFTVDTSIVGASGAHHGDFDGDSYYHAGLDSWVDDYIWFISRFGQHPNATEADLDSCGTNQFSPFQQDGDYKSTPNGGDYFCKPCHGWVLQTAWENGKHGSGRNHIANTKKMAG